MKFYFLGHGDPILYVEAKCVWNIFEFVDVTMPMPILPNLNLKWIQIKS